jgi:hypothetical protein
MYQILHCLYVNVCRSPVVSLGVTHGRVGDVGVHVMLNVGVCDWEGFRTEDGVSVSVADSDIVGIGVWDKLLAGPLCHD